MRKAWGWLWFFVVAVIAIQIAVAVMEPLLPYILGAVVLAGVIFIWFKISTVISKRRRFF